MEEDKKNNVTRKTTSPIKVYCLPIEKEIISKKSAQVGMSMARYLREVGQGYRVRGIVDFEQVREMAKINGDLGRLGGLLKMWLTDDVRTAKFDVATIMAVLNKIESTQEELGKVMTKIIMPNAKL